MHSKGSLAKINDNVRHHFLSWLYIPKKVLSMVKYTYQTEEFKSCTYVAAEFLMGGRIKGWINLIYTSILVNMIRRYFRARFDDFCMLSVHVDTKKFRRHGPWSPTAPRIAHPACDTLMCSGLWIFFFSLPFLLTWHSIDTNTMLFTSLRHFITFPVT